MLLRGDNDVPFSLLSSILRETSIDGTGWSPARRLKVCSAAMTYTVH